jgi:hypothetical protein
MSSHHFVKEGQEAAIVIADALSYETIAPVLEWSPLVIVFDKALEEVLSWSIKIDVVVCLDADRDRLVWRLEEQFPVDVVPIDAWASAMGTVLARLSKEDHHSVIITSNNVEQTMTQLGGDQKLRISILGEDHLKWSLFASGTFEKWMAKGTGIRVKGAILEKTNATQKGEQLVSIRDGIVKLKSDRGLWVGEIL